MTQDIGDWAPYLSDEKNKDYFGSLLSFLNSRVDYEIFPPRGTGLRPLNTQVSGLQGLSFLDKIHIMARVKQKG